MPFRLPARPSPGAPWARGLLSAFWERGSPDLPACGLRRGSTGGPVRPVYINQHSRPSRGAKPRGRTMQGLLRSGLTRQAREGGGEIKASGTSRGSHDASHDDQGQAGASPRSVLVSSLVQMRQAQARSTEASGKGFHISATRPRPAGWQDGGHHGAQDNVITRAFGRQRPPLVRITCTSCPLSKWPLSDPFPLNIWEEDQGLYK